MSGPGRRRFTWTLTALGRNPLIRRSDRIAAAGALAVLMALALAVPLIVYLGCAFTEEKAHQINERLTSLRSAPATVEWAAVSAPSRFPNAVHTVGARWTADGYLERVEAVPGRGDIKVGDPITVWLDSADRVVVPPESPYNAANSGIGLAVTIWLAMAGLGANSHALLSGRLNRRRSAEWDRNWHLLSANGGGWVNREG
ncbi:Rv1733c family protein [Mycolicibacterium setense]